MEGKEDVFGTLDFAVPKDHNVEMGIGSLAGKKGEGGSGGA